MRALTSLTLATLLALVPSSSLGQLEPEFKTRFVVSLRPQGEPPQEWEVLPDEGRLFLSLEEKGWTCQAEPRVIWKDVVYKQALFCETIGYAVSIVAACDIGSPGEDLSLATLYTSNDGGETLDKVALVGIACFTEEVDPPPPEPKWT